MYQSLNIRQPFLLYAYNVDVLGKINYNIQYTIYF